jgi:hypothetical protein
MSDKKTAIVTGASGGIGAGLVEAFLKEGYNVVATSLNVSQSLTASPSLVLVDGDIGKQETAAKAVEAALKHFGTIDSPLAEPLSRGVVFIQYRTENLHIVPVFGPAALAVSPRIGHIHVTVDDATWHWADASGDPVIINGLAPGRHKILIQLVNANHQPIDQGTVQFTMSAAKPGPEAH